MNDESAPVEDTDAPLNLALSDETEETNTGHSLASLTVMDGGIEVDLGNSHLQIQSKGQLDINVKPGPGSASGSIGRPCSPASHISQGYGARAESLLGSPGNLLNESRSDERWSRVDSNQGDSFVNVDEFLKRRGFDPDAIDAAAERAAAGILHKDVSDQSEEGFLSGMRRGYEGYVSTGPPGSEQDIDAALESRISNLERLLERNEMASFETSQIDSINENDYHERTIVESERQNLEANLNELESALLRSDTKNSSVDAQSKHQAPPRSPDMTEMSSFGISNVSKGDHKARRLFQGDIAPKSARKARVSTSWLQLNAMLERAGFNALALDQYGMPLIDADDNDGMEAGSGSLVRAFKDLLTQFEERGRALDAANIDQGRNRDADEKTEERLAATTRELFAVRLKLKAAENRVIELTEDSARVRKGDAEIVEKLRKDNAALQQKVTLSEHRVKAKEAVLERLQLKLEAQAKRSDASAEKGRDAFKSISGGRGPRTSSPKDQMLLEAVTGLQAEKDQMIEERELLQAEIRRLNEALRARDNALSGSAGADLEKLEVQLLSKADAVEKDQKVAAAALEEREKSVLAKLLRLERQLEATAKEKQHVEDHCDNLALELASRPTMRDWKAAQRRIAKLEQQVQTAVEALEEQAAEDYRQQGIYVPVGHNSKKSKLSKGSKHQTKAGNESDDSEDSVEIVDKENGSAMIYNAESFARSNKRNDQLTPREKVEILASRAVAEDADNLRRKSTADMIRRDKLNHRLGLNKITALPRSSAHELIQQMCRILELSDPELLVPALQKMCWIVRAMPRLENFTKQVVSFVSLHGDQIVQEQQREARYLSGTPERKSADHLPADAAIAAVMPQLKRWFTDIKKLHRADNFQNQVRKVLNMSAALHARAQGTDAALLTSNAKRPNLDSFDMTDEQVLGCLRELIEVERTLLNSHEAYQAAEEHIKQHPDVLSSRFVTHFRELFGVKSINGLFPKLNEVFVFSNEMKHFLQVARPTLGLGPGATSQTCLSKLEDMALEADRSHTAISKQTAFGLTATDDIRDDIDKEKTASPQQGSTRFKVPTWN